MRKNVVEEVLMFLEKEYPNGIQMFDSKIFVGEEIQQVYSSSDVQINYAARYNYVDISGLTDEEFNFVFDVWDNAYFKKITKNWRDKLYGADMRGGDKND